MTRTEYEENVNSWSELIEFCLENELCACEEVRTESQVLDAISDEIRCDNWTVGDVYEALHNINDFDEDFFYWTGVDFVNLDDGDFENMKTDAADEYDNFDEEESEPDDDSEEALMQPEELFEILAAC